MRVVNDQEKMLKLKLFGSFKMLLTSHAMNHEMVKIKNLIMILHFAVIWLDRRNSLLIFLNYINIFSGILKVVQCLFSLLPKKCQIKKKSCIR